MTRPGPARPGSLTRVSDTAAPRPRSKTIRDIVVSVLILLVALLVVDRVAVAIVANRLTSAVTSDAGGENVSVAIGGFPFLTQLIGGNLDDVSLSADQMALDGLTLEQVSGTGLDVALNGRSLGTLSATGLVPTATLQTVLDRSTDDSWLLGDFTVQTSDGELTLAVQAVGVLDLGIGVTPVPHGRSLSFELRQITVAGGTMTLQDLPFGIGDLITDSLAALELDLDMLPAGVTVTDIGVVDSGARITLSGTDVTLE